MQEVTIFIKNVPATSDAPFEVYNGEERILSESDPKADKQFTTRVTSTSNTITLTIQIKAKKINTKQQFSLKDGCFIMISNDTATGLKIAQKAIAFDAPPPKPVITENQQQVRRGFVVDPMTGEKRYVTPKNPLTPRK